MRNEEWLLAHPARGRTLRSPGKHIPVWLHVDDAGMSKLTGIRVVNLSGVNSRKPTWLSRLALLVFPLCLAIDQISFTAFWDAVTWSLALFDKANPVHPVTDHRNRPWPANSARAKRSGRPLCPGYPLTLTQLQGTGNG